MSVYLLGFLISKYEVNTNEESLSDGEKVHQIHTRPEAVESTRFALENAVAFLKELEDYVTYSYELPRIIHATIPDFQFSKKEEFLLNRLDKKNKLLFRCHGELGRDFL